MSYIIFLVGFLTNRFVRGGNVAKRLENYISRLLPKYEKIVKKIISADFLNVLIFTFTLSFLYGWQVLLLAPAMWLGAVPAWGEYMQALEGAYDSKFTRNKFFDYLPNKLSSPFWGGFLGMTLRGLFWGGLLAIASLKVAPLMVGLSMGVVYLLAAKLAKFVNERIFIYFAEGIFGGLLWVSLL